jgi:hypothetical protein
MLIESLAAGETAVRVFRSVDLPLLAALCAGASRAVTRNAFAFPLVARELYDYCGDDAEENQSYDYRSRVFP